MIRNGRGARVALCAHLNRMKYKFQVTSPDPVFESNGQFLLPLAILYLEMTNYRCAQIYI
jgi:hypothetical protein